MSEQVGRACWSALMSCSGMPSSGSWWRDISTGEWSSAIGKEPLGGTEEQGSGKTISRHCTSRAAPRAGPRRAVAMDLCEFPWKGVKYPKCIPNVCSWVSLL